MKRSSVLVLMLFSLALTGCRQTERHTHSIPPAAPPPDDFPMSVPGREPPVSGNGHATRPPASANGHGRTVPPYVIVPVFYATDRKPVTTPARWREERQQSGSAAEFYGKEWSETLELGWCNVSIPTRVHEIGEVERPRFWQSESVEQHFVILTLEPAASSNYFARLKSRVEKFSEQDAFVFIHGYNVTFANAIMRTAQIAHDVGFEGAPILYSWPSAGRTDEYLRDEDSVQLTVEHLKGFLNDIAQQVGPKKLHLVAHSMGNRALTEVLQHFVRTEGGPVFNEIILAAPDVNRTLFLTQILPKIRGTGKRMTLYASSDDLPLKLSRGFHDYPRAGEGLPHLIVANGLETIDATGIDTDMLGHSYFAAARPVVDDLASVVCRSYEAGRRALQEAAHEGGRYWKIRR